jgi:hypothetical protein
MADLVGGWVRQHGLTCVLLVFAAGGAWAATRVQIAGKADKTDMAAMAADVRVIKVLVCRDHPGDSMCLPPAPVMAR